MMTQITDMPDRAVLSVSGADRVSFLNGLVSNDVALAAPGRAVWAALLTAQGKWLADFFIFADGERLLLDCEAAQAAMLAPRLGRYKLRADVAIAPTDLRVFAAWGGPAPEGGACVAPDPRLAEAGWRILATELETNATRDDWDRHRLALGLPDGGRDMEAEKSVLLEAGFDELGGISWTKGCYMGQELTARTRYRGLIKKRLLPVTGEAPLPPAGTPVMSHDREVGLLRSSNGSAGLAVLRLDALEAGSLICGGRNIAHNVPAWARLTPSA
jgi:folate-binding protein YgfZ